MNQEEYCKGCNLNRACKVQRRNRAEFCEKNKNRGKIMKAEEKKNLYKIIIPTKDYEKLSEIHVDQLTDIFRSIDATRIDENKKPLSKNVYIVCNRNEPYANEVLKTILDGENEKEETANRTKMKCPKCGHDSEWSVVAEGSKLRCGYCDSIFLSRTI